MRATLSIECDGECKITSIALGEKELRVLVEVVLDNVHNSILTQWVTQIHAVIGAKETPSPFFDQHEAPEGANYSNEAPDSVPDPPPLYDEPEDDSEEPNSG